MTRVSAASAAGKALRARVDERKRAQAAAAAYADTTPEQRKSRTRKATAARKKAAKARRLAARTSDKLCAAHDLRGAPTSRKKSP